MLSEASVNISYGLFIFSVLIVDGSGDQIGIGEDVPEGKLHIFTGDASVGPNANADELVVEGSAHSGISIR